MGVESERDIVCVLDIQQRCSNRQRRFHRNGAVNTKHETMLAVKDGPCLNRRSRGQRQSEHHMYFIKAVKDV